MSKSENILVALSGGVDSAVAAHLLKEQGHAVSAAYIRTWMNEETPFADCPAQRDIEDARAVSEHLGIPFEVVNLVNEYREHVVDYLLAGYRRGLTPNPDTMCNREMKFGIFQNYAIKSGFEAMATGHYVRRFQGPQGEVHLREGRDPEKDQSYFLALLRREQLRNARFPLGDLTKREVRDLAKAIKLPNAAKKDSQGICFLGDMRINQFLDYYITPNPGPILNANGRRVGTHSGLHRYTLGQRRGIGIPSNSDHDFYVVTKIDVSNNILHVAFEGPEAPGLYGTVFEVGELVFQGEPIAEPRTLLAKPRYRDPAQSIEFKPIGPTTARVIFHNPQRAIAPGQIIALYDKDRLLGGGVYLAD